MWSSRDVALVIVTAALVFVFTLLIFQNATILTGIVGANYIFTFGMALLVSLTFLIFEGRRWRFFVHNVLVVLFTFPTTLGGPPYDVFPRLVLVLAGLPADLILNSLYENFEKRNWLLWWTILSGLVFFLVLPFLQILFFPLYFPQQFVENFTNVVIIMLPWIVGGSVFGGYLAYNIKKKIPKF